LIIPFALLDFAGRPYRLLIFFRNSIRILLSGLNKASSGVLMILSQKIKLAALIPLLFLAACVSSRKTQSYSGPAEVQYFTGNIQVSSLDGKTPYGPPYESTVRRTVRAADGMIEECVLQKGKLFYTLITRTSQPLVFDAVDTDGAFSGKLTYADDSLTSWSYDIQVTSPNQGVLSGKLPDYGAVINKANKKMSIKKIWEGKTLISENYDMTDRATYQEKLRAVSATNPDFIVRENCK
jgi:hypothetical protein